MNFAGIKAAPGAFLLLLIMTIGVSYLAFQRAEGEHLAVLENKIAEREARRCGRRSAPSLSHRRSAGAQAGRVPG